MVVVVVLVVATVVTVLFMLLIFGLNKKVTPSLELHCHHIGSKTKKKFAHIVCIKMEVNSQRRKNFIVSYHQHGRHDVTCNQPIFLSFCIVILYPLNNCM